MIEVKLQFPDAAALVAFFTGKGVQTIPAPVEAPAPSATVTPEKQEAARASTGKTKTKEPVPPATENKPADTKAADPVDEAKAVKYEDTDLPKKIALAAANHREAVTALLVKHGAVDPATSKPKGPFLPPAAFDAFRAEIDALLES